jgi:putative glycosyltransferase (TIGR04372 family)
MLIKIATKKYLIIAPLFYSIGDASEQINYGIARAKILGARLIIIKPYRFTQILSYKICNKALFEKINFCKYDFYDYFASLSLNFLYNLLFFIKRLLKKTIFKKFKFKKNEEWNFLYSGLRELWPYHVDNINQIIDDPIIRQIQIANNIELKISHSQFNTFLSDHQLDRSSKYVCLHVREPGFHGDYSRRTYRNADIDTCNLAITFLIENNIAVIRMGDALMKPLSIKHPLIIDYAISKYKSEEMDLALIKNCVFYIGMQAGIWDTALLFQKPVLTINQYEWFAGYPLKVIDRCIFKKIKINGKVLSNIERMKLPFHYTNNMVDFSDGIEIIDNNENEILAAVENYLNEFLDDFKSSNKYCDVNLKRFYDERSLTLIKELLEIRNTKEFPVPYFHFGRILIRNRSSIGYAYKEI